MAYLSFCAWLNPIKTFSFIHFKGWSLLQLQRVESLQSQALVPGCLDLNSRCACSLLGMLLSLSVPQSSQWWNGSFNSSYLTEWLPGWLSGKEFACLCRRCRFVPRVGNIPRGGNGNPHGKFHGQRSLAGWSPWDCKVRHNWACSHLKMVGGISGIHFYQLLRTGKSFMLLVIIFHLLIFLFLPFLFLYLKLWVSQISLVLLGVDSWKPSVCPETTAMSMITFLLGMKSERSNTQEMEQEQAAGGE